MNFDLWSKQTVRRREPRSHRKKDHTRIDVLDIIQNRENITRSSVDVEVVEGGVAIAVVIRIDYSLPLGFY